MKPGTCKWIEDDDGIWNTECLNKFEVVHGTPLGNGFRFCLYCGKRIWEFHYVDPDSQGCHPIL